MKRPTLVVRNVLLNKKKEVLLGLRKETMLWELPGGKVDEESVQEAAIREQREETSIELAGQGLLVCYFDGFSLNKPKRRFADLILYWREWEGVARVMEESHKHWTWFSHKNIPAGLMPSTAHAMGFWYEIGQLHEPPLNAGP